MLLKRSRLLSVLAAGATVLATTVAPVQAHPDDGAIDHATDVHGQVHDQHGGTAGHLPASNANVRLVGKMNINQDFEGRVADVGVFGNFAYLGAFNARDCQKGGVYVFDISEPTTPKQVNFIRTGNNSYVGEGVQVIRLNTAAFKGDLLLMNNEVCGAANTGAVGGMTLVDVSDPKSEKFLARGFGDFQPVSLNGPGLAHQIHSVFGWTVDSPSGQKAYAVLVDDEENFDLDIADITDPRNPKLIAEYSLNSKFPQIIQPELGTAESFLHDMVVKKVGSKYVMLASYWDGGYVTLDVTDPTNIQYIGDTDFTNPDPLALERGFTVKPEGNAHESEFTLDNGYIIAADEDFDAYSVVARNSTENTEFQATQGNNTPQIDADTSLAGRTVFVGRACPGDPPVPAATAAATIAVVERGVCFFTDKLVAVEAAGGYSGVIVMNREGSDACTGLVNMDVQGTIPALFVGRDTGFGLFNTPYDDAACVDSNAQLAPIAIGTLGDTVSVAAQFDGWGYVHLFRNGTGKLRELDTFAILQAHDPAFAAGFGDLSVHEVATSLTRKDLAYLSYYAGGFRVLKIVGTGSNARLEEVGHFIDEGGNNFWGVQVFQKGGKEYVAASDRDYGLYIFEYTGP